MKYRLIFASLFGLLVLDGTARFRGQMVQAQDTVPAEISQTFTVTTNSDGTGAGTLRTAITNANASPGLDTITFSIPGGGTQNVVVTSSLPTITDPVIIDGSTQPGYAGTPLIVFLTGGSAVTQVFNITGGNSTVRALSFFSFSGVTASTGVIRLASNGNVVAGCTIAAGGNTQVFIDGGANNRVGGSVAADRNVWFGNTSAVDIVVIKGATATGNRIVGNWFGTTAAGAVSNNRGNNILIDNAPNNFVGGTAGTTPGGACTGECNQISGANTLDGVRITGAASTGNKIIGNFFGLLSNGTTPNVNGNGVHLLGGSNNQIGGTTPAERNVFGASFFAHVYAEGASSGTAITGNYVGLNSAGTGVITGTFNAAQTGLFLNSANNRVGGVTAGERNIISGNDRGIYIGGTSNRVEGNYIGTNAAGTAGFTNRADGILIEGADNIIGSATGTGPRGCTGGCNVISGNGTSAASSGVWINGPFATRNTIAYNYIGLNAAGTAAIRNGNASGHSILVLNSNGNMIGVAAGLSQRQPSMSRSDYGPVPDIVGYDICIQTNYDKSYVKFNSESADFIAENCTTGDIFSSPPPGIIASGFGGGFFTAGNNVKASYFPLNGTAQIGLPDALGFTQFVDANRSNNSNCECPETGRQFLIGVVDFGGANGCNFNLVTDNISGLNSDLTSNLSLGGEISFRVQGGFGNVFSGNYSATVDQPNIIVPIGVNNIVTGGFYFSDPASVPFSGFDTKSPNLNYSNLSDGTVRVTGTLDGPPNANVELDFYDVIDSPHSGHLDRNNRDTEIRSAVTLGPDGSAFIQIDFSGYEAERLRAAAALAATATLFDGPVMRPNYPTDPTAGSPVRTSQMSPAVTASSTYSVSGRVTTPTGAGLKNATVSLKDSAGVRRTAVTNSFGLYTFSGVRSGETYTVSVTSKSYRFSSQSVTASSDLSNVNFTGLE